MTKKVKKAAKREENLKKAILAQYKSVRQFSIDIDMPYSSLMSALDKGFSGMAFDTVMSICRKLGVSPYDFAPVRPDDAKAVNELSDSVQEIIKCYAVLNPEGKVRLVELAQDFTEVKRYR